MNRRNLISVLFIFFVNLLIFFKIFSAGLYPIPGDLLVSFYFPWYSGGWEGYNPWTVHKELLNADAIRQIYLWKELAADQFKNGQIPLWNPYTFSGQPLAANFQSSVFYPLNFFYFIFNPKDAWILLVMIQPLLAGLFSYLFLRGMKLTRTAAVYGATVFMFSSYLITWLENGNIVHSYLWLPLIFFGVKELFESNKFRYFVIVTLSLTLAVLAGHPQTAIYIYCAFLLFWFYECFKRRKNPNLRLKSIFGIFALSLALSAIQWVPTISFYLKSPISLPFSKEVFDKFLIPYTNFVTFFAPDFFGHPATENFWSFTYGDFTPYIGVIPLVFSALGFSLYKKNPFVVFSLIVSFLFLLAAVNSPISFLVKTLRLPILDSTSSARFMSITLFLLSMVSAFGFAHFFEQIKNRQFQRKFMLILASFGFVYFSLWMFVLLGHYWLDPSDLWGTRLAVSKRNLILPTGLFLFLVFIFLSSLVVLKSKFLSKFKMEKLLIILIFFGTIFGGLYFSNKFLPVSPKKFIFPQHPVFEYLSKNAGINRFFGFGTAHVDFNFPSVYRVFGVEGYDTLRLSRYAQLMASSFYGYVPETYLRSDAVLPTEENGYRKRLLDLLGVVYFLDKEDNPKSDADWHYERFPRDNVSGVWQSGKTQIYIRKDALPRVFLSSNYYVTHDDKEIVSKIYDPNFDLHTLIVESEPKLKIDSSDAKMPTPEILRYDSNAVSLRVDSPHNSLLFISDAYDKDWNAYVGGKKSPILRAHFAFRAVEIPKGKHEVKLAYEPRSFKFGFIITFLGLTVLVLLLFKKYLKLSR